MSSTRYDGSVSSAIILSTGRGLYLASKFRGVVKCELFRYLFPVLQRSKSTIRQNATATAVSLFLRLLDFEYADQSIRTAAMLMSTNERKASALSSSALSSAKVSARAPGRLESEAPINDPARPGTRAKTRHMKPVRP